ncbi:MAG: class I SAM-dependent methyltransferase [Sulfuricella sp.]|jgi:2-polyprenyl-3-methyl-5-hydroxy-6-metoxy-1,4-benzoquinol methylase
MDFNEYSRTFLHFHTEEIPDLVSEHLRGKEVDLADLGAGDGALLVALKMGGYLEKAKKVVAVDLSPERCERLKQYTDFQVVCSDVTSIPEIANNSFDFIVCTQVIEHVDQDKLLQEIKRILRPGGTLYIASLVRKSYGWWYYKTAEGKWAMDPTHLREYASKEEFESVIKAAGFAIEKTQLSPLKLSVLEFITRRIVVPLFKPKEVNTFFVKHPVMDYLRRKINVHPPRYFIVETVAKRPVD